MKEEKKINTVQYQSDKEKTIRDALQNISISKRFTLVTFHDDEKPPIGVVTFCDDGEEEQTIMESALAIHIAIEQIQKSHE